MRLSKAIPRFLAEHPEGLTFEQLVDMAISSGVAKWEAEQPHIGRSQVESDMEGTLGLAYTPEAITYNKHQVFGHYCKPECKKDMPKKWFIPSEKNPELLEKWMQDNPFTKDYHFMDWEYHDGRYFLNGKVPIEDPESSTLARQFSLFAMKHGLTNTRYLRLFIPVCIDEVLQSIKKEN